ncbi:hypothetical protein BBJ28_00007934 [Nothophytophthora sp. Chile5]|nr:hypothetical protein BBJ28_00007934 [Nothophytophthora sp. Chile5]
MDVPSWHPANQNSDAARRLQAMGGAAASKRTEFKVMAGSCPDTSTEAGRQLVGGRDNGVAGGGRGLLDTSDRLYLMEQSRLQQAAQSREEAERDAALQSFRLNAAKLQTQKPALPEIPVAASSGKRRLDSVDKRPIVVVKAKKRHASTPPRQDSETKKAKKESKKKDEALPESPVRNGNSDKHGGDANNQTATKAVTTKEPSSDSGRSNGDNAATASTTLPSQPAAAALLLQGYSSSDDDWGQA